MCPFGFEEPHARSDGSIFGQSLTRREYEILVEYAKHGFYKAAANCLGISEQTTKNHLYAIRDKLGVQTTLQAYEAIGWLQVPGMGTKSNTKLFQTILSNSHVLSKAEKKEVIALMVESL